MAADKKNVDYSYSTSGVSEVGTGNVDKSGRRITGKVHTDGFSLRRYLRIPLLDLYIFRELLPAFIVAEFFFAFVYLIKGIQEAVEQIVNKGLPASEVLSVIGYMIGKALPLTIPMAVLMAAIITSGRFSAESEFTAMRSAGRSYGVLYRPFIIFGSMVALLTFYLANYLSPASYIRMDEFKEFLEIYNPIAIISEGEFVSNRTDEGQRGGRVFYVQRYDKSTGSMENVFIRKVDYKGKRRFMAQQVVAQSGQEIVKTGRDGKAHRALRLFNGYSIHYNERDWSTEVTDFTKGYLDLYTDHYEFQQRKFKPTQPAHYTFFDLLSKRKKKYKSRRKFYKRRYRKYKKGYKKTSSEIKAFDRAVKALMNEKGLPKKKARDLVASAEPYKGFKRSRKVATRKWIHLKYRHYLSKYRNPIWDYDLEVHQRLTFSFFAFLFAVTGMALGLVVNRSGRGMGFVAAIFLIVMYVTSFNVATRLAKKDQVDASLAPWLGVFVIGALCAYYIYVRTSNRGLLESLSSYYYRLRLKKKPT